MFVFGVYVGTDDGAQEVVKDILEDVVTSAVKGKWTALPLLMPLCVWSPSGSIWFSSVEFLETELLLPSSLHLTHSDWFCSIEVKKC